MADETTSAGVPADGAAPSAGAPAPYRGASGLDYPRPRLSDTVEDWFGTKLADPLDYFRKTDDPEVKAWVAKENALTDSWFDDADVASAIERLKADKLPAMLSGIHPWRDGYLACRPTDGASYENLVLDADFKVVRPLELPELEGFDAFMAEPDPADDGIVSVEGLYHGDPRLTVLVWDTRTGRTLFEDMGTFSAVWGADGRLYTAITDADPKAQASHTVFKSFDPATGATEVVLDVADPKVIFGSVFASSDASTVLLQVCADYALGTWYALDTATHGLVRLTDEPVEWTYIDTVSGTHHFVSMTGANNGRVIGVSDAGDVREVMPESERYVLLSGMGSTPGFALDGHLYLVARADVSRRLIDVTAGREVELPSTMADLEVVGHEPGRAFLRFESFTDAPQLLAFDGRRLSRVWATAEESHPHVVVEQRFAASTGDGTLVPYYLVHRDDAPTDGSAWALMYAYGGYNSDMPPWHTEAVTGVNVAEWVEAGNVYVHANLRGGSEYGPAWHEGGMLDQKRHCYEDYIGVAEKVIADGWTSAGRIAITGCSNGGLLNSALVTMRPELWGCVIDSVPQTDMIHVADDDRGPMYVTEYGNPRASREMFEYLLSYSPYHNVREADYPPVYVQTGECDNNVPPYHGKKFAARMQARNRSDAPVLLRVLAQGSHNRGGTPEEYWRTTAEMRLFIERAMGR